jgi:hypothetical protein
MYTSGVGLTTTIELYARFVATKTTNPCFKPSQTRPYSIYQYPNNFAFEDSRNWCRRLGPKTSRCRLVDEDEYGSNLIQLDFKRCLISSTMETRSLPPTSNQLLS